MELINFCPDCGKPFSQSKKYCACGWKISVNDDSHTNQICAFVTSEGRCHELGTIAPKGSNKRWYCSEHWYTAMQIDSIQINLMENLAYKWMHDFFSSSESSENLNKKVIELNGKINLIRDKSIHNLDESKLLTELESIRDNIVYSLYGGTNPDMRRYMGDIILKVISYKNHCENAGRIINMFIYADDERMLQSA